MNRESAHRRIRELLELLEINNNRLFLNDEPINSFDAGYLKQLTLSLYEEIEKLHLAGNSIQKAKKDLEFVAPVIQHKPEEKASPIDPITPEIPAIELKEVGTGGETNEETSPSPPAEPEIEPVIEPEILPEIEPELEPEIQPEIEPEIIPAVEPVKVPEVEPIPKPQQEPEVEQERVEKTPPAHTPMEPEAKVSSKNTDTGGPPPFMGKDIYARLRHSKIDSVKKAISISKRYELQNAFFNKDPEQYNQAIRDLDSANSMEHAFQLLDSFAQKNNWDKENELFEELQTILLRRYM